MKSKTDLPGLHEERLVIDEIREEVPGFKTFFFREGHQIVYQAGQFITLIDRSGPQEIRRSYSILSSPALSDRLSIGVKRTDNGYFSRKLIDHARVGEQLITGGASGFFRFPDQPGDFRFIFFFAAGSGIVPVLSLIKTALIRYPQWTLRLVYSNHSVQTTAYYQELTEWQARYSHRLFIHFLFSANQELNRARLNRELLIELLNASLFEPKQTLFYTCGPVNYMRLVIFNLLEEGFPRENIRKEDFNPGNQIVISRLPPDENNYTVTIEWADKRYQFPVMYPESILRAAIKHKLHIPYSCETGKCGSCAVLCLSGKVWMSDNEVLSDTDIARGLVLTCTGHPQGGDVILKIA